MAKHPAIFLDRDGTIIDDAGYINHPCNVAFYPYSFEALRMLQEHFLLFIVTNQSGIGKGLLTQNEVDKVNNYLTDVLKKVNITIYDLFCCPHSNEDRCSCKKPSPYFLHRAAELYNLDLSRSFMIGDHPSDVFCGINAGVSPLYLLSGHGNKHRNELNTDVTIKENLMDATKYIISTIQQ